MFFFFFQAEDGIRDLTVTGVQTCALPISTYLGGNGNESSVGIGVDSATNVYVAGTTDSTDFPTVNGFQADRSEEHTSELQSQSNLVCRLLLEKKKNLETEICTTSA